MHGAGFDIAAHCVIQPSRVAETAVAVDQLPAQMKEQLFLQGGVEEIRFVSRSRCELFGHEPRLLADVLVPMFALRGVGNVSQRIGPLPQEIRKAIHRVSAGPWCVPFYVAGVMTG